MAPARETSCWMVVALAALVAPLTRTLWISPVVFGLVAMMDACGWAAQPAVTEDAERAQSQPQVLCERTEFGDNFLFPGSRQSPLTAR